MAVPFPPADVEVLSIGELTRSVKLLLESAYTPVWVEGEVSNLAKPGSGHLYLTLKDDTAPLKAVIYRGVALRMRFDLNDGMKVIARGRLTVYEPRGEYQLQVEEIQPKGIGPLELAFRQLKEKLSQFGYFEPRRKRQLPHLPRRVVLLTSPTGSAVRDMLEVLSRRWPAVEVWVCPVRVQGDGAAREIADALTLLNQISPLDALPEHRIDVVIVGRGGGSLEDLWAFNEEIVAKAIFSSRIPIVSGVGHEDDLTIADLVADVRALTPTEAAERVVPDRTKVLDWLVEQESRLRTLLLRGLQTARERLADLANRRSFRVPLERIRDEERRLDEWNGRLSRAARQQLTHGRVRLEALAGRLNALSPLNVLARGFSLTRKEDGTLVQSFEQVRPGDRIVTRVQHGHLVSRVEECHEAKTSANQPATQPAMESLR